jgi:antirestriction protein ArdC
LGLRAQGEEARLWYFFKMLEQDSAMPVAVTTSWAIVPLLQTFPVFNAAQIDGLQKLCHPISKGTADWNNCRSR